MNPAPPVMRMVFILEVEMVLLSVFDFDFRRESLIARESMGCAKSRNSRFPNHHQTFYKLRQHQLLFGMLKGNGVKADSSVHLFILEFARWREVKQDAFAGDMRSVKLKRFPHTKFQLHYVTGFRVNQQA